jgi:signal transduction histidine kinase
MQEGGLHEVESLMMQESAGVETTQVLLRLWTAGGDLIQSAGLSSPELEALPQEILGRLDGASDPILRTLRLPEHEHGMRVVYGLIAPGHVIEIGQSLEKDEELIGAFRNGFLLTLAAVVALGVPIGWFMARRALRGVQEVTRAASEIAADGALDRRVVVPSRGDDLERLARAFNTMLDRIQALIIGMREMTDNLAHDFRSPLARIRSSAEMTLTGDGSKEEWESLAASTTEECDRLMQMIDTTLDIAEAESGAARLRMTDIDLVKVVLDACEVFKTVAEDGQIAIATELPDQCRIRGDLERLQRVVANLLDNALKYTPAGGRVTVRLTGEGRPVRLSFEDTGMGVSPEELPRIFQRFYRSDRSRSGNGNGLGLSLALAFVRAHGGDITVKSELGQGSTFTVELAGGVSA